jgi:hypothetical protein
MTWLTGLSLRAWMTIGAVVIAAMWSVYVYRAGYAAADAMWRAKALESKIAKLELEAKIQAEAEATKDKLIAELQAETEQQEKVINDFLAENEKRTDKCPLGDDADKLNGL